MNIPGALYLNNEILKKSKSPHERDLARMRKKILKKVKKRAIIRAN